MYNLKRPLPFLDVQAWKLKALPASAGIGLRVSKVPVSCLNHIP